MKRRKKTWLIAGGVALLVVAVVVLNLKRGEKAVTVQTAKVKKSDVLSRISAPGQVKPVTEVKISANVMGKITRLPVKEGDRVKRGQLLLEIDPAPIRAQVEQYRAALELARAQLVQSERLLGRKRELFTQGLSSTGEVEELETQASVNRAQVARDEAALRQAKEELARTTIVSPLDGVITELNVEMGEVVVTGTMNNPGSVIMTVADLSRMEVEAKVDESDIRDVRVGQDAEVTVDALPDTVLRGKVSEVGNAAITSEVVSTEESTPDFKVNVEIDKPPASLRPGMSATIKVKTAERTQVLSLPIQAVVIRDVTKEIEGRAAGKGKKGKAGTSPAREADPGRKSQEKEAVYVDSLNTARVRAVKTGITGDTDLEIISGLKGGEEVITGPFRILKNLHDGDKVKVGKGEASAEPAKKEK